MERKFINDYRLEYLRYLLVEKNYSERTINSYNNDILSFIKFLNCNNCNDISKINKGLIRMFFVELKNKNISNRSLARYYSSLNSFFKYILEHEGIKNNPMELIECPRYTKKIPLYVFESKLIELLRTDIGKDKRLVVRNRLIIYLLFDSGVRVSELVNIKVKDVDFNERSIKVFGKGSKDRYVFFSTLTLEIFNEWMKYYKEISKSEYVFINYNGERMTARSVEKIVKSAGQKIGIDLHPHMLRHTFATDLLNKGADLRMIQELLGHENLDTTQIYTHISNSRIKEVYDFSHKNEKEKN